jgi:uncharacterized protein YndB with AHSA1/START domain
MRIAIDVDATPEEVFDLYVDPARRAEWNPAARSVTFERGATNQAGSRYVVETRYGRLVVDVLEVQRPHLYRLRERSALMASEATVRFQPLPDGRCLVVADATFQQAGLLGRLLAPLTAAAGRWWGRGELRRLKLVAERSSARRTMTGGSA